jgi:REP element-mobilizing transposase RayT
MAANNEKGPTAPDRVIDPRSTPKVEIKSRGDLPHLFKDGCSYFVTFCLADAVPAHLKRQRKIEDLGEVDNVAARYDPDPSLGERFLADHRAASIVESAVRHFHGERYELSAWCVMPNHVHVVATPYAGHELSSILHSWKSYSAHQINKYLNRHGQVWESESFDHLIRNESAFGKLVDYTENNPVVARLCTRPDEWPFSSARFRGPAVE